MVRIFHSLKELDFGKLMQVYEEGNLENAREFYPHLDRSEGLLQVEQDFYTFLMDVFFPTKGAFYVVLERSGQYVSAFRMEPYQDGLLLEALETAPCLRQQGYAKMLLSKALADVGVPVYSHVHKRNDASLRTHLSCGFQRVREQAVYIDGSVVSHSCTMLRK